MLKLKPLLTPKQLLKFQEWVQDKQLEPNEKSYYEKFLAEENKTGQTKLNNFGGKNHGKKRA